MAPLWAAMHLGPWGGQGRERSNAADQRSDMAGPSSARCKEPWGGQGRERSNAAGVQVQQPIYP